MLLFQGKVRVHINTYTLKTYFDAYKKNEKLFSFYHFNVNVGDRFYIRVLLNHVRGATSFTHLRTVTIPGQGTVVCDTFREACVALGLLLDDEEWDRLLTETASYAQPASLRAVFVTVLLECQPANPLVSRSCCVLQYDCNKYLSYQMATYIFSPLHINMAGLMGASSR